MLSPSLQKNNRGIIQPTAQWDKGVHALPKGVSMKVNMIAQWKFKLVYYIVVVTVT